MDFLPRFATFTRCLVERGDLAENPLYLIDVGCGGGLPEIWQYFQSSIAAVGVDPEPAECERLQQLETNPRIQYVPRFIRLPESHPFRQARGDREPWTGNPWERTSAARAMRILREQSEAAKKSMELRKWDDQELVEPTKTCTIDELVQELAFPDVDFIKIDVDGADLEVLYSAEKTIRESPALGCVLEVNYSGTEDPTDNSFHNVDRVMRGWGFDLFELSTRRCTLSSLPAPFRWDDAPHETEYGRVLQGDALYLRDPCGWDKVPKNQVELSPQKLLKLCCLFELFGTPDHAAELLQARSAEIEPIMETKPLLHLLAHQAAPHLENYDQHIREFNEDPSSFYPSRRPAAPDA